MNLLDLGVTISWRKPELSMRAKTIIALMPEVCEKKYLEFCECKGKNKLWTITKKQYG